MFLIVRCFSYTKKYHLNCKVTLLMANINLVIFPIGPQEEEEIFTLSLVDVTGGASLDDSTSKLNIIVAKKGYPNGLFSLSSQIKPSSQINEPSTGVATVEIPIRRSFGRIGVVNVS